MQVDTATLEETESFIYAMLLFVLNNHVWITRNFVDVTENLVHEKKEMSKWFIVNLSLTKVKISSKIATSLLLPFYKTHASKHKNPLWQKDNEVGK